MHPRAALFAVNIVFILSLGAATNPLSDNAFVQTDGESALQEQASFESPPSEFVPGGNFSELPETDLPPGLAPPINIPDINGTYVNPDVGFQVDLPEDWNGKEITNSTHTSNGNRSWIDNLFAHCCRQVNS